MAYTCNNLYLILKLSYIKKSLKTNFSFTEMILSLTADVSD